MVITSEKTAEIAHAARLGLLEGELEALTEKLGAALESFAPLLKLELDLEPLVFPIPLDAPMRQDQVVPSLSAEEALANAPLEQEGMFRVPRIIEQE